MRLSILAAALALALAAPVAARTPSPLPPVSTEVPADVASPEAIVEALYDVISGDRGVARDWDRFRTLFHPAAKLMPTATMPEGQGVIRPLTPQDYIDRAGPGLVREGFHEREIARRVDRFGRIAHVFSTYEGRRAATDADPFLRGINSIQLFDDGTRWWIVSVYWQAEDATTPLPPEYLPAA